MAEKKTRTTTKKRVIAETDEKHIINESLELINTKRYQVIGKGKEGLLEGKVIEVSGVVAKVLLSKGLVTMV